MSESLDLRRTRLFVGFDEARVAPVRADPDPSRAATDLLADDPPRRRPSPCPRDCERPLPLRAF